MTDRPLRVGEIRPESMAFWDAVDDRRTCGECRHAAPRWTCASSGKTQWPAGIKHRCERFDARRK